MKIFQSIFSRKPGTGSCLVPLLLILVLLMISCAKVGDPLPPLPANTVEINDLRILRSGNDVFLTFPPPVRELSEIEVYRLCEGDADSINETSPIQKVEGADIKAFAFLDRSGVQVSGGDHSPECVYAVRTRNLRGKQSRFSNSVQWLPARMVAPPAGLKAETAKTRIRIEWKNPVASDDDWDGIKPEFLINFREITDNRFYSIDEFEFGKSLSFEVRTIARAGGSVYLSDPVKLDDFVPDDFFPPQAPSGLVAVFLQDRVQLTWDDNRESDLAGYYVYRTGAGSDPRRISALLTINRFVDENPPGDQELTYSVTAVDTWDNESDPGFPIDD